MGNIRTAAIAGTLLVVTGLAGAGCGTTIYVREPAAATATMSAPATSRASADPAAPSVATAPPASATGPALTNPSAVVTQFYQDITDGDYSAAWALGGQNLAGGVTYAQWAAGYQDTTASISVVTASDWNGTTAYAEITAVQLDGSIKTYTGTYTVISGVIQSANIQETS